MLFEELELHPRILAGLGPLLDAPLTPVQEQALPAILEGNDVLILAPPGDDLTLTFVLPILQHALLGPRGRVPAGVLAPTQELADAILAEIQRLGRHTRARSLGLCSGSIPAQLEALREGVEIVVGCPARVVEHLNRGSLDLSHTGLLALEDVDRLCDLGFLPEVSRILKATPPERQTVMTATTDNEEVRRLAQTLLRTPVILQIGEVTAAPRVAHHLYQVEPGSKTEALLTLLDLEELPAKGLLVFCGTRFRARRLGERLKHSGYATAILTDELSPKRRELAIESFRQGVCGIMVTTDAAAQGLNVTGVTHVLNFDMPPDVPTYLHRSGRTAYDPSRSTVVNLVTPEDVGILEILTLELEQPLQRRPLPLTFA